MQRWLRVFLYVERDHSLVLSEDIRRLAETANDPGAQAALVGCTGQELAQHRNEKESVLGKPRLMANQLTSWHALS